MRKNLERYVSSNNIYIRQEYNHLRFQLGSILRELGELRVDSEDPENITLLDLDSLRAQVESSDVMANGTLDQLIRDDLITDQMAVSLMNDNAYTYNLSTKLLEMAGILFAARAMDLRETERSLQLSEEELESIAQQMDSEEVMKKGNVASLKKLAG